MTTVNSRPGQLDWGIHQGRAASITLTGCPEAWASASVSALVVDRLGSDGVTLATATVSAVDVGSSATVTVTLSAVQTADLPTVCAWVLIVDGDRPIAGAVRCDTRTSTTGVTSAVVSIAGATVTVSVLAVGPAGPTGPAGATGATGATGPAGPATTDASALTSGTLPAARIGAGSITADKVAADVATQAELDAHAADTTDVHGITDTTALGGAGSRFASGRTTLVPSGVTNSTLNATLNVMYVVPFDAHQTFVLADLRIDVSVAAAAGGVVRLGLYGPGYADPGALVADFGTVDTTSTGIKTALAPTTVTVTPGRWWVAYVVQVAGCTVRGGTVNASMDILPTGFAQITHVARAEPGVSGSLPSTTTAPNPGSSIPRIGVTAA